MAKKEATMAGTKLAELAKAPRLKGKVCITDEKGITHEYADETAAHTAWKDKLHLLEHRRGAFFVKADAPAPALATPSKSKRS
jgi:hypothetical protein